MRGYRKIVMLRNLHVDIVERDFSQGALASPAEEGAIMEICPVA
jgi:hypothetical protein